MPQLLEETEVKLERLDLRQRSPIARPVNARGRLTESPRAPGAHVSGILWYIATESGMKKAMDDIGEEELPLRMALGLAWEEFAASLYPDIHWQPGEWIEEDVAMNCDGVSGLIRPDDNQVHFALEEFKLTWKKVRTGAEILSDEWYWMQQGRAYCWGYGAQLVRWHVCYVNGDYRGGGPVYKRYLVSFTEEEIGRTGQMILANKQKAIEKGFSE